MKRVILVVAPIALLLLVGASASPAGGEKELIIRLQGEVLVLQKQLRDLQESFDKSQGQITSVVQKLSDNSEHSLRTLAAVEDSLKSTNTLQSNNLTGTNARLNRIAEQISLNDQRLSQISGQITNLKDYLEQQQQRQREAAKQADESPQFNNAEQLYAFAYSQFSKGNHEQAIANFRRYLDAYGQTEASDNAQFWIAESYYSQARYDEALREYERLLTSYPKGDKVAGAHFKKGSALLQLERRDEGVAALRAVISSFPQSPEAALAAQELRRLGENPEPPAVQETRPAGRQRSKRGTP